MLARETPPLLSLRNLRKRFGALEAVSGVDLTVESGQVTALLGDNGAGKSTLVKIVAGVFRPNAGRMELSGQIVNWRSPRDSRAAGIEVVYQDLGLVSSMSIARNFFLGKELTLYGFLDVARMRTISREGIAELGVSFTGHRSTGWPTLGRAAKSGGDCTESSFWRPLNDS